jgi:uncharacterized tellurite resistance protein B-like protein
MLKSLTQIRKLLTAPDTATVERDELETAVAVLLIEAARRDDTFDGVERSKIEELLAHKFELSPEAARQLIAEAEATADRTSQLYPFTRLAVERMSPEQRVRLIEMLWEVAYADGVLDPEEDVLVRRIAGLIYVSDVDRAAARQRVLARIQAKK